MDSAFITIGMPIALVIIMMGLGFEVTLNDFKRVKENPKNVIIALFCQLVLLITVAFCLAKLFKLEPLLAVGLMVLAASPGGSTANLFSYLFKGDIALNITLTAFNSVIAAFTLPLVATLSLTYFMQDNTTVGIQLDKLVQVFLLILLPLIIGMIIRAKIPNFAKKMEGFIKYFSVIFLIVICAGALIKEGDRIAEYFSSVGLVCALFCAISLSIGYFIPKLFKMNEAESRACAFEIGIHNSSVALTIAISVLGSVTIAIPAAVYSVIMIFFAFAVGFIFKYKDKRQKTLSYAASAE
ncbi:bile acid:sodium symporter family protein [Acinetobacter sp. ANC 4945]|uniref:Bile acid:sodium symporter n=1 Tax=Acinetobacter amyesii TaxID=2942470 RepID=A0A1T1GU42_9GAMM|nr:bile acid:sodium symporter family protein [Acinetobacter amyesii]MCL6247905.1 bile acid:sodium symporter family protein [Acinetobacter amyesii]OOV81124.1 bile acid:sodium symporter [Acinetobacter amyesii]